MSVMDIHTPKIGVVEIIGIVAAAAGLMVNLRKLLDIVSDAKSEKKANVNMLVEQLQSIIREYEKLNKPTPTAVVEVLNRLEPKAQKLLKSVSSRVLRRLVSAIAHGSFDTRIGKLRTGITDIGNTLLPPASHVSSYQASPALVLASPSASASTSASASASISVPGQMVVQVTVTSLICPVHHNVDVAQAPVVMQDQHPVQAAPLGYPSGVVQGQVPFPTAPSAYPPIVYSPAVYPPVLYPASVYPSFGSPAYGYAHGYTPK